MRFTIRDAALYFLPISTRMPLKFGSQVLSQVVCARVWLRIEDQQGHSAEGWGETPLSVAWVWPNDSLTWAEREEALKQRCRELTQQVIGTSADHPLRLGWEWQAAFLNHGGSMPHLAALLCLSPFDVALYDAFGRLNGTSPFALLGGIDTPKLNEFLGDSFQQRTVADYLRPRQQRLHVWHLVGGLDPLEPNDLNGSEPQDGYPVLLSDWIRRDGLSCLKVKLRGTDALWDYERMVRVGTIAINEGVDWLSADFNCTVTDPAYVLEVMDRLMVEQPRIYAMTLYIEQPFPYELSAYPIKVHSVSSRKPLFLDESAHDWRFVKQGFELGWNGVALKTCKTLTGALLSLCWAREHGMSLMVQDLTNPMLALIPHVLLAAHAGTLCGVECNAMQFYPAASLPEEKIHPGLYRRSEGQLDLSTLGKVGFGYREAEMGRNLPPPDVSCGG